MYHNQTNKKPRENFEYKTNLQETVTIGFSQKKKNENCLSYELSYLPTKQTQVSTSPYFFGNITLFTLKIKLVNTYIRAC